MIIALNLLGLAILVAGTLVLNELRRGLIEARIDSLETQGELIANIIAQAATTGSPEPQLDAARASDLLQFFFIPRSQRARLFDAHGNVLADSYLLGDRVEWRPLPPARKRGAITLQWGLVDKDAADPSTIQAARVSLQHEISRALKGDPVSGVRRAQNGERVVSVSIPVQRVQAVLGVLTLEASDVDQIVAAQRRALMPFILVAIGVTLLSSGLLTWMIARPIIRLAGAADRVRLQQAQRKVALAGAGGAGDQGAAPEAAAPQGDQAGVDDHARVSGSSTMKRAPSTRPSGAVRLAALMRPPWAWTIWRAIDRPRPEWLPNAAPLGRAV